MKYRIAPVVIALLLFSLASAVFSNYMMYRIALKQDGTLLEYTARSHSRLIKHFILHHQAVAANQRRPFSINEALDLYIRTLDHEMVFGETGEFVIARISGDSIQYYVNRHPEANFVQISMPLDAVETAHPMEIGISGKSGIVIGDDYRNVGVLAGYAPVRAMDLAIIVKIDLSEIREPFISGAAWMSGILLLVILGGAIMYMKKVAPLLPALGESYEQMRLITDALPMLVAKLDRRWRYRFMNCSYERWFGIKREDYLGRHLWDLIGRDAFERVRPFTERAMSGEIVIAENILPYPLGGHRYVEAIFMPSRNHATGETDGYLGIVTDITERRKMEMELKSSNENLELKVQERTIQLESVNEALERELAWRKQAEAALRESEEFYRMMYEVSPDGVLMIDPETALAVQFNDTAAEQLGYTREEFAGLRISDYEAAERPEDTRVHMEKIMRAGYDRFETRHRTKNGEIRNVLITVQPIPLNGKLGLYSIFRDITDMKRMEARLEAFVNGLNESALLIDPAGNVLLINETGAMRLNRFPEEMTGRNIFDFLPSKVADSRRSHLRRVLDTGRAVHFEDEREGRFYRNSLFPVKDAHGEISSIAVIAFDNTEIIAARNELNRAKTDAENATRLKDKFVMLVSHDLKNPVVGILSMLQLMQKYPGSIEESKPIVDMAADSCRKMLHMIDELLDISRIREGKLQLRHRLADGAEIVRRAVALVADVADRKWVSVRNRVPVGSYVYADPVFLQQVFYNLLTNAVKFSREGGIVTVSLNAGDRIAFTVEDTGTGIPAAIRENIFDYNEKTSLPGTAGETGAGFGLPLSYDIMKAHNGTIELESPPEGGARFRVILPTPEPKIMIIESCAGVGKPLIDALGERGFSISRLNGDGRALETLEGGEYDLLIVQLSESDGNCQELVRHLGGIESLKRLPVIGIGGCSCGESLSNGGMIFKQESDPAIVIEGVYAALCAASRTV